VTGIVQSAALVWRRFIAALALTLLMAGTVPADPGTGLYAAEGAPVTRDTPQGELTSGVSPRWPGEEIDPADLAGQTDPVPADPAHPAEDTTLLLPPSGDDEWGLTVAEVAYQRSMQVEVDPTTLGVVPPDGHETHTTTQAEIQRLPPAYAPTGPDAPVLPPGEDGGPGMTAGELAQIRSTWHPGSRPWAHLDVVPPH